MDTLDAMRVFTAVAERSGFSAAADALDRSTANVTRQVAALEQRLGTRLLNRTTRRVSLTSAGTAYYQRCLQLLADLDDLEATIGAQALEPSGVLRVNAPVSYGIERLGALLPGFRARYPQVELDLSLTDRLVDMVEEGFDVAIRIPRQPAPMLIARQLGKVRLLPCAAPAYLARAGTPRHPSDLAGHECLLYQYSPSGDELRFHGPDGDVDVRIHGGLRANNGHVLNAAALAGQGIVMQPDFLADAHIASGRLLRILPDYQLGEIGIFAVYASRSHLAPKVRSFIDYLLECLAEPAAG
ncbi:LysR family transcriptional regulator [Xanthomonas arboricola]|uniref:LysR family transcriptional regulator n=1 Tax=Xanthomonas arboricola TaxID=56448 RepID=UPI000E1F0388|nr:LysR family transcriptional regulator [Xanthomonas arboricola]